MADDIVNRLRELREVLMGNPIMAGEVQEAMDEIERLRKLMSDYVSLWYQVETGRSLDGVHDPENVVKAYHAKFHEMKEAVRHDES